MRILLVEDKQRLSGYIAKGLLSSGYAMDAVYDGEAALHEHGVNSYDLIILDLNLLQNRGCFYSIYPYLKMRIREYYRKTKRKREQPKSKCQCNQ